MSVIYFLITVLKRLSTGDFQFFYLNKAKGVNRDNIWLALKDLLFFEEMFSGVTSLTRTIT